MSEANRVNLLITEEGTFNETPATPLNQEQRFTSESLGHDKATVESEEIIDKRHLADLAEVGVAASGDLTTELSFGVADKLIAGALCSSWGSFSGVTVDKIAIQAVAASQKLIRTSGSWVTDGFTVNQWVRTRGFSNAENNGLFQVSAVTATDLTLTSGTDSLVDEAAATGRVVQGLFGTTCVAGQQLSAANADNSFSRASGSFVTDGFQVGQRVRMIGFATAANNTIWKIETVAATKITVSGGTVQTDVAADGCAIFGDHIRDGQTKKSFHIEKQFKDLSNTFISYRGLRVGKLAFSVASRQIMKLVFTFLGSKGVSGAATVMGNTTPANSNKLFVAGANVASLKEGGSALTVACKEISWEVENGLEGQETVTSKEYLDISLGSSMIKGKLQLYFGNLTHYNKFQNHTESSIEKQLQDVDSNVYYVTFPTVKYSNMRPTANAKNTRIIADAEWTAMHNDTYDCQMMIDRIPV